MNEMRKLIEAIEEAEKLGSDSAAGKWAADTLKKNGIPAEPEVPIDFVMRQLQQKVTETAYKAQQLSSYIKRTYPEEKEKYNVTVDVEMELDRLRKMIFDVR